MAVIVAEKNTLLPSNATTLTVALPAHESGDLLVVKASQGYGGTIGCSTTGWTVLVTHSYGTGSFDSKCAVVVKKATSSAETPPVLTSANSASWAVSARTIKGWKDTGTIADAFANVTTSTTNAFTTTNGRSKTYSCAGVTTTTANSLVMCLHTQLGVYGSNVEPQCKALWLGTVEVPTHCMGIAYKFLQTAGATGDFDFVAEDSFSTRIAIVVFTVLDDGTGDYVMPYLAAPSLTVVEPWFGTLAALGNLVAGSLSIASLLGRTIERSAGASENNAGASATDRAFSLIPVVGATIYGSQRNLYVSRNASAGFMLGTYRFTLPSYGQFIGRNDTTDTGICITLMDASNNYDTWCVGGLGDDDMSLDGRNTYVVQLNQSTDTRIGHSESALNKSAVTKILASFRAVYGDTNVSFAQTVFVPSDGITVSGGSSLAPITGKILERYIGKGHAVTVIKEGLCLIPLVFSGNTVVDLDLYNLRFPRLYSAGNSLTHVDAGALGITIDVDAGAVINMTNGSISAPEPWHFTIHADSSPDAEYGFTGRTLVNAIASLQPVTIYSGMGFVQSAITQNGSTMTGCTFSESSITSDNPGLISDSTFTSGGTGHSMTITVPGSYTISGLDFVGYGADDTTDASIYNNSGGAVTLNVSSGTAPTVRNGTSASTTVVAGATLTIAANVTLSGAEIRIYDMDNSPAGSLGTELSGTESHGSATYTYSGTPGNTIWIQIMKSGYKEYGQSVVFPDSNSTFTATLAVETNT